MKLEQVITKDELDREVRHSFYISGRAQTDVSHTVSYTFARNSLKEAGLDMGLDCNEELFKKYQIGEYKVE